MSPVPVAAAPGSWRTPRGAAARTALGDGRRRGLRVCVDGLVADRFEILQHVVLAATKVVVEPAVLGVQAVIRRVRGRIVTNRVRLERGHVSRGIDDVVIAAGGGTGR